MELRLPGADPARSRSNPGDRLRLAGGPCCEGWGGGGRPGLRGRRCPGRLPLPHAPACLVSGKTPPPNPGSRWEPGNPRTSKARDRRLRLQREPGPKWPSSFQHRTGRGFNRQTLVVSRRLSTPPDSVLSGVLGHSD